MLIRVQYLLVAWAMNKIFLQIKHIFYHNNEVQLL